MTKRRALLWAIAAAVIAAAAFGIRHAGTWLVRDDRPALGAPFYAVLIGDQSPSRAERALQAVTLDPTAAVLLARERASGFAAMGLMRGLADIYADVLQRRGVAPERIVVIPACETTSTAEEAQCLLTYVKSSGVAVDRLPVVTSWYHTSRAGWLFEQTFRESGIRIEMIPAYPEGLDPATWWRGEDSFLAVFNEYLKWTYWLIVAPSS